MAARPWTAPVLTGTIVRLEPLTPAHADGLWEASRDPRTWTWLSIPQPSTREELDDWLRAALGAAAAGLELPLVTTSDEQVVGSTRYLALRPEHGSVEIGWTWLHPSVWGTGVNVEAKLLMLEHAFATWGCRRVELKTDARNERSRGERPVRRDRDGVRGTGLRHRASIRGASRPVKRRGRRAAPAGRRERRASRRP